MCDHPQMIQLTNLDQTVQQQPPSDTPATVSHIIGEVVNSLWIIIPQNMGPSQIRDDASPIEDTIEGQDNDMTNELTVPEQWIDDHSQDADSEDDTLL